jgi:hypothetical protein
MAVPPALRIVPQNGAMTGLKLRHRALDATVGRLSELRNGAPRCSRMTANSPAERSSATLERLGGRGWWPSPASPSTSWSGHGTQGRVSRPLSRSRVP